jgi:anti-sigma B factor antagonist
MEESSRPQRESKLAIEERHVDDVAVLSLKGEMTLDDGELKFGRLVDDLLNKGQRKILVDLTGVTYIDSAGVGMMVFEWKAVHARGGALKLLSLTGHGLRLLGSLKLITVFEVFEDEAMAVRSFARN